MAEPSSSFRLSSQISFRDPWPSVVVFFWMYQCTLVHCTKYGTNVAKLEMCSSEFSLCNSRIGWVTRQDVSVWGVEGRSKLARSRFFLELKGLSKAHPAATHWCFSFPASLTSSWTLGPQEHQLLLAHIQLLWLLSQVCVLLCDKRCQILQGSPILAVEVWRQWESGSERVDSSPSSRVPLSPVGSIHPARLQCVFAFPTSQPSSLPTCQVQKNSQPPIIPILKTLFCVFKMCVCVCAYIHVCVFQWCPSGVFFFNQILSDNAILTSATSPS